MIWRSSSILTTSRLLSRRQLLSRAFSSLRCQNGAHHSFVRVRPPANPPFSMVSKLATDHAAQVEAHALARRVYRVSTPDAFHLHSEVMFAGTMASVSDRQDATITLVFPPQDDLVLPVSGPLQQPQLEVDPLQVANSLSEYWYLLWNRDSQQATTDSRDCPSMWIWCSRKHGTTPSAGLSATVQ